MITGHWHYIINWRDATHFDSEGDYRTGCRNVSHCQQQQSYSVLYCVHPDDQTQPTYEMIPGFKPFTEELYVSKKVEENARASEGKLIMPTRNNNRKKVIMCVTTSQSEKKKRQKSHLLSLNVEPSRA